MESLRIRYQQSHDVVAVLDNTFSGIYDAYQDLTRANGFPDLVKDVAANGLRLGLPGGGVISQGATGATQDYTVTHALQNLGRDAGGPTARTVTGALGLAKWRAQLTNSLIEKRCLKKIVESISVEYYGGHALLFRADENLLNSQIACLEDLMKDYSRLEGCLPDWKPIDLGPLSSVIAENAELQVENLAVLARAKTLVMFGEEQAASELLDSTGCRALRELKRLRSLTQPQDSLTC